VFHPKKSKWEGGETVGVRGEVIVYVSAMYKKVLNRNHRRVLNDS
jgi:hypothetical protein